MLAKIVFVLIIHWTCRCCSLWTLELLPGNVMDEIGQTLNFEDTINIYTLNKTTHQCRLAYVQHNTLNDCKGLGKTQRFKVYLIKDHLISRRFLSRFSKIFFFSAAYSIPISLELSIEDIHYDFFKTVNELKDKKNFTTLEGKGRNSRIYMNEVQSSSLSIIHSTADFINLLPPTPLTCIRKILLDTKDNEKRYKAITAACSKNLLSFELFRTHYNNSYKKAKSDRRNHFKISKAVYEK